MSLYAGVAMMERGFGGVHGGVSNPRQSTISMV